MTRKMMMERLKSAVERSVVPCENPSKIIVFDVETTGLYSGDDEIVQFSAIDGAGNVLLNTYVKPYLKRSWPEAAAITGITPEVVADAPYADEIIPKVRGLFEAADLWISYNGIFDLGFLHYWGVVKPEHKQHYDVMRKFAPIYGDYNSYYGDYKWQKLGTAAAYYGYDFKAHDSLEDVRATLFVYQQIEKHDQND